MAKQIEHCLCCEDPTGRAGPGDDSLYVGTIGPFCESCHHETGVADLEDRIRELEQAGNNLILGCWAADIDEHNWIVWGKAMDEWRKLVPETPKTKREDREGEL